MDVDVMAGGPHVQISTRGRWAAVTTAMVMLWEQLGWKAAELSGTTATTAPDIRGCCCHLGNSQLLCITDSSPMVHSIDSDGWAWILHSYPRNSALFTTKTIQKKRFPKQEGSLDTKHPSMTAQKILTIIEPRPRYIILFSLNKRRESLLLSKR